MLTVNIAEEENPSLPHQKKNILTVNIAEEEDPLPPKIRKGSLVRQLNRKAFDLNLWELWLKPS